MNEYIITHEQLKRLFGWIDQLTEKVYPEYAGDRLGLYTQLEVPPIVRCKDCENWCIDTCQLFPTVDEPDGFCAWGERKVVEQ